MDRNKKKKIRRYKNEGSLHEAEKKKIKNRSEWIGNASRENSNGQKDIKKLRR